MPEAYIRRSSALAPNQSQKPQANTVRVDTSANEVKVGTGTSGTTELTLVDTTTVQTLTGKVLSNPTITAVTPISVTTTPITLGATHVGRTTVANKVDGITFTLPAATGTGNKYRIVVGTTLTSSSLVVQVANALDYMRGFALLANDTDGSASNFETANTGTVATESDTITLNRTTTGIGTIGDVLEFEDIASAIWSVHVKAQANGTEATPFTVAV